MRFTLATSILALAILTAAVPQPVGQKIGVAIPISKRSGFVNADGSVDIEALNSHVESTKVKIFRGFKNFEMNTGASHPSASKGIQRRSTGAVPLTTNGTQMWYGSISVGTPANTFTVGLDTGSSDMILPGPYCQTNCAGHTIYNPSSSSTSQDLGMTFTEQFGDGSTVSGEQHMDTVTLGGLTATGQTLGVALLHSSGNVLLELPLPPVYLVGMAYQSISAYPASPVFQTLFSQGQTNAPVFSFKLAASGSELYLGGANSALYTGGFSYAPVTNQGFWEVNMNSIKNNGQTILSNIESIIDTGTTLVIGVPSQVTAFYAALGGTSIGQGYYSFPCNSFPSVSFTFGDTSFPISAASLNIGLVFSGSTDCISGIVGRDTGSSSWIVGDVFLKNVYTTFDLGNDLVGFAQLA